MNELSTEIATYRVIFKDKTKPSIPLTNERAAKIMDKISKRQFCAIQDMNGKVHGEQWTNIERVEPLKGEDMKKKAIHCWTGDIIGIIKSKGEEKKLYKVKKMLIHDLSVVEEYEAIIDNPNSFWSFEKFPKGFTILNDSQKEDYEMFPAK